MSSLFIFQFLKLLCFTKLYLVLKFYKKCMKIKFETHKSIKLEIHRENEVTHKISSIVPATLWVFNMQQLVQ